MKIKEIVSMIETETKEVTIIQTSKMITRRTMREVNNTEKDKEEDMTLNIKTKNTITTTDKSTKIKKSTRKNNHKDKYLMTLTIQRRKRERMEKGITKEEEEVLKANR